MRKFKVVEVVLKDPINVVELPVDAQLLASHYRCHEWRLTLLAHEVEEGEPVAPRVFVQSKAGRELPECESVVKFAEGRGSNGTPRFLIEIIGSTPEGRTAFTERVTLLRSRSGAGEPSYSEQD